MKPRELPTTWNVYSDRHGWVMPGVALFVAGGVLLLIFLAGGFDHFLPGDGPSLAPRSPSLQNFEYVWQEQPDYTAPPPPDSAAAGRTLHVAPNGDDANDGLSADAPLKSIQTALDRAEPGDTVLLAEGQYFEDFRSRRDGTRERPITLYGKAGAIIKGSGKSARVIEISHDYLTLTGFTVDGLVGNGNKESHYRDKLIYVQGKEKRSGVTGLKLQYLTVRNAGGECVRLRYFAEDNEIAYNTIERCGAYDFALDGDGKNGEGIYIGTAPEQRDDGNPTEDTDVSRNNWIHHNRIDTRANECVDIKEGSTDNIVEYNQCTGQRDKESGGLGSRGSGNIFRYNLVHDNRGAGVRLGGDKKTDGIDNEVYGNTFRNNQEGGIKIMRKPQARICSNTFAGNGEGKLTGDYGDDWDASDKCS